MQNFIMATAGHVDHGKSALVKALTGTDPDRLPEERARGITIDLGFACLELPLTPDEDLTLADPTGHVARIGIVDVPGHEDFVKNMVAGVGSIDLAVLVVAADDGWMPQSEEHLQILGYLGVERAVIALTKIDLVQGAEEAAVERVRSALQGSTFAKAPVVKTSVATGAGLEELKSTIAEVLSHTPPSRDIGKPRLPVDRAFTLHGIGTVVTGTLIGGVMRRGQTVVVQPSGLTTRIRSIQSHNRELEWTGPGTRTALNLPDVSLKVAPVEEGISRGNIISAEGLGEPSPVWDVLLTRSGRGQIRVVRPLKDGTVVRVHHGSANYAARLRLLEHAELAAGEHALARLRFEVPVFALIGDRFIVRDWPEQATLAGGLVLDTGTAGEDLGSEPQRKLLEMRAQHPNEVQVFVVTQVLRDHAVRAGQLLVNSRFSTEEVVRSAEELIKGGEVIRVGEWLIAAGWWKAMQEKAAGSIQTEHRNNPERLGTSVTGLRTFVQNDLSAPELFNYLLAELARSGFVVSAGHIRHQGHSPALPSQLQAAGSRLRKLLSAKPYEPPSRKELAPDLPSQQALRFLVETGEAIEVGPEVVLSSEGYANAIGAIADYIARQGPASVSELRQAIGTSRRIMVPLLEKLDREGVTVREGDKRTMKSALNSADRTKSNQ